MSFLGTASRFAVLKIDDEDVVKAPKLKTKKSNEFGNIKPDELSKKSKPKPKKKPAVNDTPANRGIDQELQSMAFGKSKPKKVISINPKSSSAVKAVRPIVEPVVEDPQWQKRNEEVASKLFEDDIQEAIFLSKVDYEEKKEFYQQMQQETEETAAAAKKKKKNLKKEKSAAMTLLEFNNLPLKQNEGNPVNREVNGDADHKKILPADENFFDKVDQDAKKMFNREQEKDYLKKAEPNISVDVRLRQVHYELEKKESEIQDLLKERDSLKEDNARIKKMNAKLCNVLANSQRPEYMDTFLKIDELNKEKDELTQEITSLHAALEQEKSKVHALQQLVRTQVNRKEKQ